MSRKSAPPRRGLLRHGPDVCRARQESERAERERQYVRACVRARARSHAPRKGGGQAGGGQGGGTARPSPATARRTALSQRRRGGRPTPAARGRERSERGAVEGARGPVPRTTGPRRRARGERATRQPGQTRREAATRQITTAGRGPRTATRTRPSERGRRAARDGGAPRAQQRNDATAAGRRQATERGRGGPREATRDPPLPSPPLTEPGEAERDGQAAAEAEARRPHPRAARRGGERRGGGGGARQAGGRRGANREVDSREFLARRERTEGKNRTGGGGDKASRFVAPRTTRGPTAREAPPQTHGRSRGNPGNADWLFLPRHRQPSSQPRGGARRPPPPTGRRPPPLTPQREDLESSPRFLLPGARGPKHTQHTPGRRHRARPESTPGPGTPPTPTPPPEVGGWGRGATPVRQEAGSRGAAGKTTTREGGAVARRR